ncbi:hypothetical protein Tco_1116652 [Tanacetum coccineum]
MDNGNERADATIDQSTNKENKSAMAATERGLHAKGQSNSYEAEESTFFNHTYQIAEPHVAFRSGTKGLLEQIKAYETRYGCKIHVNHFGSDM